MTRGGVLLLVPLLVFSFALGAEEKAAKEEQFGWLGVYTENLNEAMLIALNVENGVLVTGVVDESPAATAGVLKGDVIQTVDGQKIDDPGKLRDVIRERPEKRVNIALRRRGKGKTLGVTLGAKAETMKIIKIGEDDLEMMDLPEDALKITRKVLQGIGPELEHCIEVQALPMDDLREEIDELKAEIEALKQELKEK